MEMGWDGEWQKYTKTELGKFYYRFFSAKYLGTYTDKNCFLSLLQAN